MRPALKTVYLHPWLGSLALYRQSEAIKVLTAASTPFTGRLMLLDALHMEWRTVNLKADPKCPICSSRGRHDAPQPPLRPI